MIHYELIGAVRDPYISKCEVEIRRERLEAIKEEIILSCSEIKHHKFRTTNDIIKHDERIINFHSKKIGIREGRGYDPDLEEYLVEYDEIIYPIEVKLIEEILEDNNDSLEELLDIIYNPKKIHDNNKYQNKLLETREKRNTICELIKEGKLELPYGVVILNQLDDKIENLESHIERNKNQKSVCDFYQSLRESFIFHMTDMLLLKDLNKTLDFFNYYNKNKEFVNKVNRIKRKI